MPKQIVEAKDKKKHSKNSKASYFANSFIEVIIGFHICLLIFGFVMMPISFICIAIIGIPKLWSDLSQAYYYVQSSIGWNRVAEAFLSLAGLSFGLKVLWLLKGSNSRNEQMTFSKLRCVISHDYAAIGGHEEPSDPMFDYYTVESKCRRCSSKKSETTAYSNDFR